jgi:hypothetical protein
MPETPAVPTPPTAFRLFRWSVFTLLGINVLLFFSAETVTEGLDSLAWLGLLLLFELEAREPRGKGTHPLLHTGRGVAYLAIAWCAISYSLPGYVGEYGRLDSLNAWTWIAIVMLLELDVRAERAAAWGPRLRRAAKPPLYGALLVYALLWGLGSSWLDFYDALLWILCFFTIELQLFGVGEPRPAGAAAPSPAQRR